MNILGKISYSPEYQKAAAAKSNKTFNPIVDIIGQKYKAIEFTQRLFRLYPGLFDNKGASLYYIQNAGQVKKATLLFQSFDIFVTQSPDEIMNTILNGLEPIDLDVDPLFSWARYIKKTKKCYIFEPIMKQNNIALQTFLNNKNIIIRGKSFTLRDLKPLCYTNTGENVADLLPYIAYLFNFFINCKNYTFGEILAGSSRNVFMEMIDANFSAYYQKLIDNNHLNMGLTQLFADESTILEKIPKDVFLSMFSEMLNPENIIKIRNNVILADTSGQLQSVISTQTAVSEGAVSEGFSLILAQLIELIINKNPISQLFQKIPVFREQILNEYELSMLTQYALSGGIAPFMVDNSFNYCAIGDLNSVKPFPFIPRQQLATQIEPIKFGNKKPYSDSALPLNLMTAYIKQEFQKHQTDILVEEHIGVDESFVLTEKFGKDRMENILTALFVNGIWNRNNKFLNNFLHIFDNNNEAYARESFAHTFGNPLTEQQKREIKTYIAQNFKTTIYNVQKSAILLDYFFNNSFGAKIIPAYILSFLPQYLLEYITRNSTLDNFDLIISFCRSVGASVAEPYDLLRIEKLMAMETAIMFLHNTQYAQFVNEKADEFTKILLTNVYIQQPYIKGSSDPIDVYAIGGRGLVEKAAYTNPLIRAYWFIACTQGTCENLEDLYEYIKLIDNNYAFQLMEKAIREKDFRVIASILSSKYTELIMSNRAPILLNNYTLSGHNIAAKSKPWFIDLTFSNNRKILEILIRFVFPIALAKNTQDNELMVKPIVFRSGVFYAGKSNKNNAIFGETSLPITRNDFAPAYALPYYDFNTTIEEVGLVVTAPPGYHWLHLVTDSGRGLENDAYFVFTKINTTNFNGMKYADNFDNIFDDVESIDPTIKGNRPKNRMNILGLKKREK